uniref:C2H2-type domain-containing protein n=1 Tax=Oryzias sinensis TaxID=183150 RepID=A0A8C7YTV4_9TELE
MFQVFFIVSSQIFVPADLSEKHICKENEAKKLLWKEERSSSLDEQEPELPVIKEDWDEVCIKGEQLELKQKNDSFMVTEDDQEKMDFKPKPRENPVLEANNQIRISNAVTVQLDFPSQENSHSCDALGKDFTQKGHLKTHTRIHITDMPYSCKVCQKCYTQSSELKVYMRTHTGKRPFTCKICERGFITNNGSLKSHLRTHTGERPFTCEVCLKSFAQSETLKVHMRTHTGERPFTCKICERGFTPNQYFKVHMRKRIC